MVVGVWDLPGECQRVRVRGRGSVAARLRSSETGRGNSVERRNVNHPAGYHETGLRRQRNDWVRAARVANTLRGRKDRSYGVKCTPGRLTHPDNFLRGVVEYGIYPRCVRVSESERMVVPDLPGRASLSRRQALTLHALAARPACRIPRRSFVSCRRTSGPYFCGGGWI